MSDYMEETGDPFTGKKKEELKKFLEYMGLTYDEQITHSIVLRKEKEIIATASCQKNIIKCVAVSEAYQGQNLLAHLMTSLIEYFYGMGISPSANASMSCKNKNRADPSSGTRALISLSSGIP